MKSLNDFLTYLRDKGRSEHTIKAYRTDLLQYQEHNDPNQYLRALRKRGLSSSSCYRKMQSVAQWLKFNQINLEVPDVKVPKSLPKPIQTEDYEEIINRIKTIDMPQGHREVLLLLVDTGRRVSEILNLSEDDIIKEKGYYIIRLVKKGGDQDVDFITPYDHSYDFLEEVSFTKSQGSISYWSLLTSWRKVTTKYTIHQLRHTLGTRLANDPDFGITFAQRKLGHKSIQTTTRYTEVADEEYLKRLIAFKKGK